MDSCAAMRAWQSMLTDIQRRCQHSHSIVVQVVAAETEDSNASVGSHRVGQHRHALRIEHNARELEVSDRRVVLSTAPHTQRGDENTGDERVGLA